MGEPYYRDESVTVYHGDCLDVLRELPDASVDAVVTDPPYLLSFMGRAWDTKAAHEHLEWHGAWAAEAFRLLKPGGHMLAFGGSRTWHRLACAVEDAGFEIRDSIAWLYGSGFPKSLDVSKAIDKAAGAERETTGRVLSVTRNRATPSSAMVTSGLGAVGAGPQSHLETIPATPAAQQWAGWGTALKPAFEPVVVARRPLAGTVAANVLQYGTGALNVDACRLSALTPAEVARSGKSTNGSVYGDLGSVDWRSDGNPHAGRWPANVVLDPAAAAELDRQSGDRPPGRPQRRLTPTDKFGGTAYGTGLSQPIETEPGHGYTDSGGASRFFPTFRYEAKAPTAERPRDGGVAHPTVKPLALLRFLVRLVTPPGGVVLDPFAGSGTTAEACVIEGFRCITVEREAEYLPLIMARLSKPIEPVLDLGGFA